MIHSSVTRLPNNMPYEVCPSLIEVWEFKYDDPSDWAWVLDNLGYCFEAGVSPLAVEFVNSVGELEMFELHWVMLGKLTHMTTLK